MFRLYSALAATFVLSVLLVGCTDPNGLAVRFQLTRKRDLQIDAAAFNTWQHKGRIDQPE